MKKFVAIVDGQERIQFDARNFEDAYEKLIARHHDGQFSTISGLLLDDDANPPAIERAYRMMAEGDTQRAMEELEREFQLRPVYLERAVADLIARARA